MRLAAAFIALAVLAPLDAAPITIRDLDGRAWTPLAPAAGQAHVILFVMTDCPISNGYAPEIARLASEYQRKKVETFVAYVDPGATADRIRGHVADYFKGAPIRVVNDAKLQIAGAAGATITPAAALYTSQGRAYRGRIDDLYVDIGRKRRAATTRDLRNALEAALARRPVPITETQAVGGFIERAGR